MKDGDSTNTACPRRCGGEVVYNGNYFCNICDWDAPEGWINRNPRAYRNLMDSRARYRKTPVESLINFNVKLYARGEFE